MGTSGQQGKLSTPVLAFMVIVYSFVAGVVTLAGVDALKKEPHYDWMISFAMSLFFLLCAIDRARELVRRIAGSEVAE